jgi:hypothetical protein
MTKGSLTLTLSSNYSPLEVGALQRWATVSKFSDPSLRATIPPSGSLISSARFQRSGLRELQTRVPHLRNDPMIILALEVFWRTLIVEGKWENNEETDEINSMFNCFMGWRDPLIPKGVNSDQQRLDFTHRFRRRVAASAHGRQFFITHQGRLGLAPIDAKEGDIVCVLLGCVFPVVLRREGNHHAVVGETYINGIMSGEAIEKMENGELEKRDFVLH